MPARQPFTQMCQLLALGPKAGRADLHLHTTASDGAYRPEEVVDLARRCGLAAVAITDHDTFAGVAPARAEAERTAHRGPLEIITGVEITAEHAGRELHLLGYFLDEGHSRLAAALTAVCRSRVERYEEMKERLRGLGVTCEEEPGAGPASLGRRHLAEQLVRQGKAGSVREAFARWLRDGGPAEVPKQRIEVGRAIELVRAAGGVASWAHPPYDEARLRLGELAGLGLGAVEIDYPSARRGQAAEMRQWAANLGLAVSGGSDCHGPGPRGVGACGVSDRELEELRRRAGQR